MLKENILLLNYWRGKERPVIRRGSEWVSVQLNYKSLPITITILPQCNNVCATLTKGV